MTKEISKWADDFMFEAAPIDSSKGPEVFLLGANADPLGSIAHAALAYVGDFRENLSMITDDERRHYLGEIQKTALAMPLETVNFEFMFRGVTRGFTHQLVRQRTASYSQESTRFAVKSGVPVGLPPSLIGSDPMAWIRNYTEALTGKAGVRPEVDVHDPIDEVRGNARTAAEEYAYKHTKQKDRWRYKWDRTVGAIEKAYNELVDDGMPAEDGRGLLPTNLLTQVNYNTSLRGLQDHAGLRLCTQAQFEWRLVWNQIVQAIRKYGMSTSYKVVKSGWTRNVGQELVDYDGVASSDKVLDVSSAWQFDALADLFRPICYKTGKCEFKADFDRKCTIRDRVDANASINRPSTEWGVSLPDPMIRSISPVEWLMDPSAAR